MAATDTIRTQPATCDPQTRVTKSLLGYGVIAGPVYVTVSLAQAMTREGFDLSRHAWSLLSNGALGWIQVSNLVLAGLMVLAASVGLARALSPGRGATWVPRLIGGYGLSLVAAGILRADPALGFPAGTPDGPGTVSWHGVGHLVAGAVGFACLIAACWVMASRFAAEGRRGWVWFSRITGVVFFAAFAGIASGGSSPIINLALGAVLLAWGWLSATSAHRYRAIASHRLDSTKEIIMRYVVLLRAPTWTPRHHRN
jgi:hypothetical protein